HRRAFSADTQKIVEGALRVQQRLSPALVLLELELRRQQAADAAVVINVKVIARLRVFRDKMVFQKLIQHLQQLALRPYGVQNVPRAQVVNAGPALNQAGRQCARRPDDAASGKPDGDVAAHRVRAGQEPKTQGVGLRS